MAVEVVSNLEVLPEAELDRNFLKEVEAYPGGEKIKACIQCGTCSGSCQMSGDMDYTPRQIILMIRTGMKKEVLSSKAIWYCASCYLCTVRCPRQIKITEVFYALKSLALKEKLASLKERSPAFYLSFYQEVEKYGRMYEPGLIIGMALKTNPFDYVGMAPFGWNMFRKGKIDVFPHRIKGLKEIKVLAAEAKGKEGS